MTAKVEQALKENSKQLSKEEKKAIKADVAALNKLLLKSRPEKMSRDDLDKLRSTMEQTERSAAELLARD